MTNEAYLDLLGVVDKKQRENCLSAMAKYESNHWWEEGADERLLVYYQLREPVLLCWPFSRMYSAIEHVLHRTVYTHEFVSLHEELLAESETLCNS